MHLTIFPETNTHDRALCERMFDSITVLLPFSIVDCQLSSSIAMTNAFRHTHKQRFSICRYIHSPTALFRNADAHFMLHPMLMKLLGRGALEDVCAARVQAIVVHMFKCIIIQYEMRVIYVFLNAKSLEAV